ncbi:hypothetical protein O6H91_15G012400 [Diphasiastrum complanatum]|nr:hypothetical protein O6H91_15G012400 [Diphasiastrum complanatum]
MKLAQELCLQPRQVAVWYQNRRARWKSKQLEQDYDILKMGYEALLKEKQKLEAEVISLTDQLISREATTKSVQGEDSGNPAEVDSQQHLDSEEETSWETEFQAIEPTELQTSRPLSEKAVSCIMKPSIEENSPKSDGYNSEVLDVGSPTPVDRSLDQQELEGMNSEQHTIDDHALDIFTCHPMVEGLYGTVYNNSTQLHEQIGCKLEDGLFHSDHEYHYCNTAEEPAFPTWWYWP